MIAKTKAEDLNNFEIKKFPEERPHTIIGIDPDAEKHGVSVYIEDKIVELQSMTLAEFSKYLLQITSTCFVEKMLVVMEDNTKTLHVRKPPHWLTMSQAQKENYLVSRGNSVGRNQQAQIEIQRILDKNKFSYILIKPTKTNSSAAWKENEDLFKRMTKWRGRSNPDTRSAAYFGWFGVQQYKQNQNKPQDA